MTELFDIYQENIKTVFSKLTKILENIPIYSREQAEQALQEADSNIKEADRLIKNMEIQSFTSSSSNSENDNSLLLKNYKSGIDSYKKRILKSKDNLKDNKKLSSLILTTDSSTQKEKLITSGNEETMWKSFDKLENAKRATIEMENVSIEIGRELVGHTEKMKGVGNKLGEMNKEIRTSNSVIGRMMRLQRRNKLILVTFSLCLIIVFLVIVYVKFVGGGEINSNTGSSNNSSTSNIIPSAIAPIAPLP